MNAERAGGRRRVEWVTVGVIVAAHGVRGEVRVRPLTDFPERFLATPRLFTAEAGGRRERAVLGVRPHGKGMYLVRLAGVNTRDEAEALRGTEVQVPREEAHPLPEGSYYVFDLVDCRVETPDGKCLGRLVDVLPTGANDVYQVRREDGTEVLIPAVKGVVLCVDTEAGVIVVDPPPGI